MIKLFNIEMKLNKILVDVYIVLLMKEEFNDL